MLNFTVNGCIFAQCKKKIKAMAKKVDEVEKELKVLLQLVMKKTNVSHKKIVEDAERDFIRANLDVVTAAERKQFKHLVF